MKQLLSLLFLMTMVLPLFSKDDTLIISTGVDRVSYAAGDTVTVSLNITIPEGHHLYANPLGPGVGRPVTVTPGISNGITWLGALQQKPEKYLPVGMEDQWVWSWHNATTLFVKGVIGESAPAELNISLAVKGLICKTACIPVATTVTHTVAVNGSSKEISEVFKDNKKIYDEAIPMPLEGVSVLAEVNQEAPAPSAEIPQWTYTPQENERELNLVWALIFAFIAGLILNFMPCVLPVLGIKILAFSKGRTGSKKTALIHSIAFAAGMISIFLVLATLAAFAGMSWGEQFQNPVFIVVLVSMMFIFALGMFDLFIIFVPNKIAEMDIKQDASGFWGNFAKGMFATILATPCSGPFLGATLAWTLTQPKLTVYLVFLALGVGMASPYVLLAASKRLSRIIPKPGAWMEDFKHIMGFFLLGFAVYLMIGLPRDMVLPTVALLISLAAIIMFYGRLAPFGSKWRRKTVALILSFLLVYAAYVISFKKIYPMLSEENVTAAEKESVVKWQPFSVEAIEQAHAEGRNIMIDFTANWCMNCQFNKLNVYHSKEVEELIIEKNVLAIKADLTEDNKLIESLRNHLGSRSVPFLAIFNGDNHKAPVVMRDLVSRKNVVNELKKMSN